MDLPEYLRILARRWRAVTVLALLGAATGALAALAATPQYRATATLFVSLQNWGDDSVTLNQGNSFAQARVRSYAEVVVSPRVTEPVVRRLHLRMTPSQLAGKISTEVPLDTVLLKVTVSDPEPARAARISNAVADRFAQVIADIEQPAKAPVSPVRLSITEPAGVPTKPYSPNFALDVALALAGGLVMGGGWAFARESLDASVRSRADLTKCLIQADGPSVLGCVTYDADASECPVAANHDPFSRRAEDFRRLRTGLQFVDIDNPPKIIAVTSAVPGEGKTSISINLAAALSEAGSSVCLVDADLRRPNVARTLRLIQDAGLTTVMIGDATPEQVMQSGGSFSVLASGALPPNPAEMLGSEQFRAVVRSLADKFDHVVVDTAPLLPVADTPAMAPAVDGYLLVARHGKTHHGQIVEAVQSLHRVGATALGGILNMTPLRGDSGHYTYESSYRPTPPPRRRARFWGRRQAASIEGLPAPSRPAPLLYESAVTAAGTSGGDTPDARSEQPR